MGIAATLQGQLNVNHGFSRDVAIVNAGRNESGQTLLVKIDLNERAIKGSAVRVWDVRTSSDTLTRHYYYYLQNYILYRVEFGSDEPPLLIAGDPDAVPDMSKPPGSDGVTWAVATATHLYYRIGYPSVGGRPGYEVSHDAPDVVLREGFGPEPETSLPLQGILDSVPGYQLDLARNLRAPRIDENTFGAWESVGPVRFDARMLAFDETWERMLDTSGNVYSWPEGHTLLSLGENLEFGAFVGNRIWALTRMDYQNGDPFACYDESGQKLGSMQLPEGTMPVYIYEDDGDAIVIVRPETGFVGAEQLRFVVLRLENPAPPDPDWWSYGDFVPAVSIARARARVEESTEWFMDSQKGVPIRYNWEIGEWDASPFSPTGLQDRFRVRPGTNEIYASNQRSVYRVAEDRLHLIVVAPFDILDFMVLADGRVVMHGDLAVACWSSEAGFGESYYFEIPRSSGVMDVERGRVLVWKDYEIKALEWDEDGNVMESSALYGLEGLYGLTVSTDSSYIVKEDPFSESSTFYVCDMATGKRVKVIQIQDRSVSIQHAGPDFLVFGNFTERLVYETETWTLTHTLLLRQPPMNESESWKFSKYNDDLVWLGLDRDLSVNGSRVYLPHAYREDYEGVPAYRDVFGRPYRDGDWRVNDVFGWYYAAHAPWIWNDLFGWFCVDESSHPGSLMFFWPGRGWMWTRLSNQAQMYDFNRERWIYYLSGTDTPKWFYDYTGKYWFADTPGFAPLTIRDRTVRIADAEARDEWRFDQATHGHGQSWVETDTGVEHVEVYFEYEYTRISENVAEYSLKFHLSSASVQGTVQLFFDSAEGGTAESYFEISYRDEFGQQQTEVVELTTPFELVF